MSLLLVCILVAAVGFLAVFVAAVGLCSMAALADDEMPSPKVHP